MVETIFVIGAILAFVLSPFLLFLLLHFYEETNWLSLSVGVGCCMIWVISIYSILDLLFSGSMNLILSWTCLIFDIISLVFIYVCLFLVVFYSLSVFISGVLSLFYSQELRG